MTFQNFIKNILKSIQRIKFFKLRPLWVIPSNKQSQEVCKCVYHENVDMVLEALQNKAREKKLKTVDYQKISNADSIWKETVCDVHNEDCV